MFPITSNSSSVLSGFPDAWTPPPAHRARVARALLSSSMFTSGLRPRDSLALPGHPRLASFGDPLDQSGHPAVAPYPLIQAAIENLDDVTFRSPNFDSRRGATIDKIVIHYTAGSADSTLNTFLRPGGPSAHFLIPDSTDANFNMRHPRAQVFQLVEERHRAWHAGVGRWAGDDDVNSRSIGIEIVNNATERNGKFSFPPYKTDQMRVLSALLRYLLVSYPDIQLSNVIGHSDMTARKSDPGPQFPWETLGRAGLSAWYRDADRDYFLAQVAAGKLNIDKGAAIDMMEMYGYPVGRETPDDNLRQIVRSFEMHFCPSECGIQGELGLVTVATLYALCCQHCPELLCQHPEYGSTLPPLATSTEDAHTATGSWSSTSVTPTATPSANSTVSGATTWDAANATTPAAANASTPTGSAAPGAATPTSAAVRHGGLLGTLLRTVRSAMTDFRYLGVYEPHMTHGKWQEEQRRQTP